MALRLLIFALIGLALVGCVPTPAGRATSPPATTSAGSRASADATAVTTAPSTAVSTASPPFVRPTPRPSPTFLVYEVGAGDTLTSIARQFGTTARSIAYWNRSRYPSLDPDSPTYQPGLIKTGWLLLFIPTAVVDEDELPPPTPDPSPTG
jgi:hypothetical protein